MLWYLYIPLQLQGDLRSPLWFGFVLFFKARSHCGVQAGLQPISHILCPTSQVLRLRRHALSHSPGHCKCSNLRRFQFSWKHNRNATLITSGTTGGWIFTVLTTEAGTWEAGVQLVLEDKTKTTDLIPSHLENKLMYEKEEWKKEKKKATVQQLGPQWGACTANIHALIKPIHWERCTSLLEIFYPALE